MASHLASLWNRGLRQLGNGLFFFVIRRFNFCSLPRLWYCSARRTLNGVGIEGCRWFYNLQDVILTFSIIKFNLHVELHTFTMLYTRQCCFCLALNTKQASDVWLLRDKWITSRKVSVYTLLWGLISVYQDISLHITNPARIGWPHHRGLQ